MKLENNMPYIDCQKYPLKIKMPIGDNQFLCLFSSYPKEGLVYEEIIEHEVMLCDDGMKIIWIISPEIGCTDPMTGIFEKNYMSQSYFSHIFEKNNQYYALKLHGDCFLINMRNGLAEFDHWGKY
jgi:hypothetical protein